jgi:hypothetical protein
MKVSIFGGASPRPGEPAYEEARQLGFLLGKAGHVILTGGYFGIMEAASRGACEAGAHVIGATCDDIEAWRGTKANQWVREEWHFATLRERLYALVDGCDAAIALPGGVGTLTEICALWNQMIINLSPVRKPLILVGEGWQKVITDLFTEQGSYIRESDRSHVRFVAKITDAANLINGNLK